MHIRRQQLLGVALGVAIWGAALTVQAALIFDVLRQPLIFEGLRQRYTIEVLRQGQVVTSVSAPSGATLQIDADSVSNDKAKNVATFRGKVLAKVKLADEVVFSVSADEMRVVTSK